ncbi:MAG TPA: FtsQ-type POTRA domain-containing protein [Solirubrobacteraceae bacterium]|jgi:cell division protein FtsQ
MDRSFAGRLGIGAVTPPARREARRRRRKPSTPVASGSRVDRALALLWRLPGALARAVAALWALARAHRRLRIGLIAALIAAPALGGGWLWLRHSSLVAVREVRIAGAHGADASAIDSALTAAARRMSTLDVRPAVLRTAVAAYPIVARLDVHASFPHSLSIRVVEQPPVAAVDVGGARTAVAADGIVLGPAHLAGSLPALSAAAPLAPGERVRSPALLAALAVLGAAPAPLAAQTERAFSGSKGLTVVLHGGVRAYFGDGSRPHAKWLALARVLADPSSAGAAYVDVRVPERAAAGFAAGVTPPAIAGATEEGAASTPSSSGSSQALAEGLSAAVGTGRSSAPATGSSGEHEAGSSGEHEAGSSGEHEAPSSSGEAEAATGGEAAAAGAGEAGTGERSH